MSSFHARYAGVKLVFRSGGTGMRPRLIGGYWRRQDEWTGGTVDA